MLDSLNFPDSLESSQRVSERFQTVSKVFGQSGRFQDGQESFQIVQKVSRQPGKFLDNLEGYNQFGKFPDSLERQRYVITWTKSLKL